MRSELDRHAVVTALGSVFAIDAARIRRAHFGADDVPEATIATYDKQTADRMVLDLVGASDDVLSVSFDPYGATVEVRREDRSIEEVRIPFSDTREEVA